MDSVSNKFMPNRKILLSDPPIKYYITRKKAKTGEIIDYDPEYICPHCLTPGTYRDTEGETVKCKRCGNEFFKHAARQY